VQHAGANLRRNDEKENKMTQFPPQLPHGEISEVFPDVFFVTGSVDMMPGIRISRSMTILRDRDTLTLVSPIRLDEAGLKTLDALGRVENIVKLGAYHLGAHNGLDDTFYVDLYNAKLCALDRMEHKGDLTADHILSPTGEMPVSDVSLFVYDSPKMPEALFLLNREGGIVVAADSLQNWAEVDEFFSEAAAIAMTKGGFIRPANIGPEWMRHCAPDPAEFDKVAELAFRHLFPSHGRPLLGTAKEELKARFAEMFA